jgi:hypothetical protein
VGRAVAVAPLVCLRDDDISSGLVNVRRGRVVGDWNPRGLGLAGFIQAGLMAAARPGPFPCGGLGDIEAGVLFGRLPRGTIVAAPGQEQRKPVDLPGN